MVRVYTALAEDQDRFLAPESDSLQPAVTLVPGDLMSWACAHKCVHMPTHRCLYKPIDIILEHFYALLSVNICLVYLLYKHIKLVTFSLLGQNTREAT